MHGRGPAADGRLLSPTLPPSSASRRQSSRQVLAEMIEHRAYEIVLTSEMPMDQAVVDTRARRDVTDRGCRGPAFGKQIRGRLQNRSNDFIPAQRCIGAPRAGACANCSHVTTVPAEFTEGSLGKSGNDAQRHTDASSAGSAAWPSPWGSGRRSPTARGLRRLMTASRVPRSPRQSPPRRNRSPRARTRHHRRVRQPQAVRRRRPVTMATTSRHQRRTPPAPTRPRRQPMMTRPTRPSRSQGSQRRP